MVGAVRAWMGAPAVAAAATHVPVQKHAPLSLPPALTFMLTTKMNLGNIHARAVLFVVAEGISATGGLDAVLGKVLGRPRDAPTAVVRMMLPVGLLSSAVNNTPIVVMSLPVIVSW